MKKNVFGISWLLIIFLSLTLSVSVGCSGEPEDRLVSVDFGVDDGASRSIFSSFGSVVAPEDCFWTYTAVKTDGYYTTGASEKNSSGKLIERRISDVKGLSGVARKFSQGKWTFSIFGYSDEDCTQLIYTAEKSDVSFTSASQTVLFTLKNSTESGLTFTTTDLASDADKAFSEKGVFEAGDLYITTQSIRHDYLPLGSTVLVELFEGTTKIASSFTTVIRNINDGSGSTVYGDDSVAIAGAASGGYGVHISPLVIESGREQFTAGSHIFTVNVTCTPTPKPGETSVSPVVIGTCTIDVPFIAGAKTTVYGYFSDLSWESKRLPVGGTIFYVGPDNGATYHFFDCMGRPLTNLTVDGLKSAYTYTVDGLADSAKDRFYVWNKTLLKSALRFTKSGLGGGGGYGITGGRSNIAEMSYVGADGKVYSTKYVDGYEWNDVNGGCVHYKLLKSEFDTFGYGKSDTAYVMNFTAGHSNPLMDANNHVKSSETCWYYLANDVNKTGSSVNKTGQYDWYVPSFAELDRLLLFDDSVFNLRESSDYAAFIDSTITCCPGVASAEFAGCCVMELGSTGNFSLGWREHSGTCVPIRSF